MKSPVKIWRNQKKTAELAGITGEIITYTIIRVPPGDFSSYAPYAVALVKLINGIVITAQVSDYNLQDDITGKKVITIIRKVTEFNLDGVIPYGLKVKIYE